MFDPAYNDVCQTLRKMHCDRKEQIDHTCVGEMLVTREGYKLNCKLCGKCDDLITKTLEWRKLTLILNLIGVDIKTLHDNIVDTMINIIARES